MPGDGRLLRATALPLAALGFLMVLNPFFAGMVLQNDYGSLYASYQLPPGELLKAFSHLMGRLFLAMAAFGVIVGLVRGRLRCTPMTALSLFGVTWLVLWFGLARQYRPPPRHRDHAVDGHCRRSACRRSASGPRAADLGATMAGVGADIRRCGCDRGLRPLDIRVYRGAGTDDAVLGLPRAAHARRFRRAAATYRCLAGRAAADAGRRLQCRLNYDLVDRAETQLFGNRGPKRLSVLPSPQIDSRDPLPVEDLLRSGQVVVAMPFQYHLASPSEQDVVRVVIDAMTRDWPIARDFVRGARTFHLDGGTDAAVYRRVTPTSIEVALDTFRRVREEVGPSAGAVSRRLVLDREPAVRHECDAEGARNFYFGPPMPPANRPLALTMLRPVRGHLRVEGEALLEASACGAMRLKLMQVGSDTVHGAVDVPTGRPVPFGFSLAASEPVNLMLRFERTAADAACHLNVTGLRIIEAPVKLPRL